MPSNPRKLPCTSVLLAVLLLTLGGCSGGGGGGGVAATAFRSSFSGTFGGGVTTARMSGDSNDAIALTLGAAPSPRVAGAPRMTTGNTEGTFFLSDGRYGTVHGDLNGRTLSLMGTLDGPCAGTLDLMLTLEDDDSITIDGTGDDCIGSFFFVGAVDTSVLGAACVDLSGTWDFVEATSVVCTSAGVSQTETSNTMGTAMIVANGCDFDLTIPGTGVNLMGSAVGDEIALSGELVGAPPANITVTSNEIELMGSLVGDELMLIGNGTLTGTTMGFPLFCEGTSVITLTRQETIDVVELSVSTFVPADSTFPATGPSCGADAVGVFNRGNDRLDGMGNAVFMPNVADPGMYRTSQEALVYRDGTIVNPMATGPEAVELTPRVGTAEAYATDALADGTIDPADDDGVTSDCILLETVAAGSTAGMTVTTGTEGDVVTVLFEGTYTDPIDPTAPPTDWRHAFAVDFSTGTPRLAYAGQHDGFPAHEVYVNDVPIWTHDPGAPGCTAQPFAGAMPLIPAPVPDYCVAQTMGLAPPMDVAADSVGVVVPRLLAVPRLGAPAELEGRWLAEEEVVGRSGVSADHLFAPLVHELAFRGGRLATSGVSGSRQGERWVAATRDETGVTRTLVLSDVTVGPEGLRAGAEWTWSDGLQSGARRSTLTATLLERFEPAPAPVVQRAGAAGVPFDAVRRSLAGLLAR
jgi:hypothetical protein